MGTRDLTRLLPVAASLVIGVGLGAVGMSLVDRGDDPAGPATEVVLASTVLGPLPAAPAAAGNADVVSTPSGRVLRVDVTRLERPDGFYEVWLIDESVERMVPIGVLSGTSGTFSLPDDLDLGGYPVVDVSVEPLDGDPVHSGRSVLRGQIST